MLQNDNKLARTRHIGYKPIIRKKKKQSKKPKTKLFNPDKKRNWVFDEEKSK